MITDRAAYERICERERWEALSRMSIEESIALGESLLTSAWMALARFPDDDPPMSLARALGIPEDRIRRRGDLAEDMTKHRRLEDLLEEQT